MSSFYWWGKGYVAVGSIFRSTWEVYCISHHSPAWRPPLLKYILISKPFSLTLTSRSTHYNSQTLIKSASTLEITLLSPSCHTVSSGKDGDKCFNFPSYLTQHSTHSRNACLINEYVINQSLFKPSPIPAICCTIYLYAHM